MAKEISSFLAPQDVLLSLDASCKRGALKRLSEHVSRRLGVDESALFEALLAREQLGSTGIGHGIALPHARIDVGSLKGVLARLKRPIDFESVDDQPVDIVFLLLAPEAETAEHLKALSRIARMFRSKSVLQAVRGVDTADALYDVVTNGNSDAEAA